MSAGPESYLRRGFHYRTLVKAGARFVEINGAAVAEDYGAPEAEAQTARRLGLADLSPLPRTGFKGLGTVEWLSGQGVEVPGESNRAVRQADGALALRLAPGEVMILGDLAGQGGLPAKLNQAWNNEVLPPRRHAAIHSRRHAVFPCRATKPMPGSWSRESRPLPCSPRSARSICACNPFPAGRSRKPPWLR